MKVFALFLLALPTDAARTRESDNIFSELEQTQHVGLTDARTKANRTRVNVNFTALRVKVNASLKQTWGDYGAGFDFGNWFAPSAACEDDYSVWSVAQCLYGMANGNLGSIFPTLAGQDGQISYPEWQDRVGRSHASLRIFITLASQEGASGGYDDSSTIDWNDWMRFVSQAQSASGSFMDVHEWSDYVAAAVTSEALFDAANGHVGQIGFFRDDKLNTYEWANAFYQVGGADGSVTLRDFSTSLGLQPRDVHKVFKFIEDIGDAVCDRSSWFSWESEGEDESKIDQCEWNQLITKLQEFAHDLSWEGISKGTFSVSVSQMITAYYQEAGTYTRYNSY